MGLARVWVWVWKLTCWCTRTRPGVKMGAGANSHPRVSIGSRQSKTHLIKFLIFLSKPRPEIHQMRVWVSFFTWQLFGAGQLFINPPRCHPLLASIFIWLNFLLFCQNPRSLETRRVRVQFSTHRCRCHFPPASFLGWVGILVNAPRTHPYSTRCEQSQVLFGSVAVTQSQSSHSVIIIKISRFCLVTYVWLPYVTLPLSHYNVCFESKSNVMDYRFKLATEHTTKTAH
jgi:hypothetical protein